jgi:DNA-directed RNA polymerase subunit RPC12/RpoP
MGQRVKGSMWCARCGPVMGVKNTHKVRNSGSVIGELLLPGASLLGSKVEGYVCPNCGGRVHRASGAQKSAAAGPRYNVNCPRCSASLVSRAGDNIRCPKCGFRMRVWPREEGPRDQPPSAPSPSAKSVPDEHWFDDVASVLRGLGFVEEKRTATNCEGVPAEGQIHLEVPDFSLTIHRFSNENLARRADQATRAKYPAAFAKGCGMARVVERLLFVAATGSAEVVDAARFGSAIEAVSGTNSTTQPAPAGEGSRLGDGAARARNSEAATRPGSDPIASMIMEKLSQLVIPTDEELQRWTLGDMPPAIAQQSAAMLNVFLDVRANAQHLAGVRDIPGVLKEQIRLLATLSDQQFAAIGVMDEVRILRRLREVARSCGAPAPRKPMGMAGELKRLADMHRAGDLTDEEFAAAKRKTLQD